MNDNKCFIVNLKDGKSYTFDCAHYIYRIDTEMKLLFVMYFGESLLRREDILVVNLDEFSHIELFNF